MQTEKFSKIFEFQKKSKRKAGEGLKEGEYPFYTSSPILSKYSNEFQFPENCLIFGTGGNPSIHLAEKPFSVSTDCLVAKSRKIYRGKIDNKFVYYYFKSNIKLLEKGFRGIGLKHISKTYIENLDIPIPPIYEQKQTVERLDRINLILQKRNEAIDLLDNYLKGIFLEMFSDLVFNSQSTNIQNLGSLLESMTSGSRGWAKYFSNDGTSMFLTIKNVGRDGRLHLEDITRIDAPDNAEAKRTKVKTNDVIMSITADLGRTAVVSALNCDAYINQHLTILRLKNGVNPIYVCSYLNSSRGQVQIQAKNRGAAKAGLNFESIKGIDILLPPIEVQNKFASISQEIEKVRHEMLSQHQEIKKYLNNLMQDSFIKYEN